MFRVFLRKSVAFLLTVTLVATHFLVSPFVPIQRAIAAFNPEINYQGRLLDAAGDPVTDDTYNMQFKLHTALSGGSVVWTETHCYSPDSGATCNGTGTDSRIETIDGLFSVMLGSVTSLADVDFNQELYLSVNIGGTGTTPSYDGEMSPRKVLGAVPAAFVADTIDGIESDQFFRNDIVNATSSATTSLAIVQNGAGKIAEFFGPSYTSVLSMLSTGEVGVGTSTPDYAFQVHRDASQADLAITTNTNLGAGNTASLQFISDNDGTPNAAIIGQFNDGSLRFSGASSLVTPDMVITDAGFIGIGTTSPYARLSVVGQVVAEYFTATSTTASSTFPRIDTTDIEIAGKLYDGASSAGTNGMVLQTTGTGVNWVATSSLGITASVGIGSAITSSTAGSVLYIDSSGNLAQDNAGFYYDATKNYLNLGTSTDALVIGDITGNARGADAVDLQSSRGAATQVAGGAQSTAVGYRNTASNASTVAVGASNSATNLFSTAIGSSNTVAGGYSVGLGYNNSAASTFTLAIGASNSASAYAAKAVGYNNTASGVVSLAVGHGNTAASSDGVVVGNINIDSGSASSVLVGSYNEITGGTYGSLFGYNNTVASASNNVTLLGNSNDAWGADGSTIVGYDNYLSGITGAILGSFNNVLNTASSTVVGLNNYTDVAASAFMFGESNSITTSGQYGLTLGYGNTVSQDGSFSIGVQNNAEGYYSFAMGQNSYTGGSSAVAFGYSNSSSGQGSLALGYNNSAFANYSSAVGSLSQASGLYSNAFGYRTQANAAGASTFGGGGNGASVNMVNSTANSTLIGPGATTSVHILGTGEVKLPYFTATSTTGTSTISHNLAVAGTSTVADILPSSSLTYSLGSSSSRWDEAWVGLLNLGTSTWSLTQSDSGRFSIFDQASGAGTERFTITPSGNVGIGTTAPSQILHVTDSSGTQLRLDSGTAWKYMNLGVNSSGEFLIANGQSLFAISETGDSKMRTFATQDPSDFNNSHQVFRPDLNFIGLMSDHQLVWRSAPTGNFFSSGSVDVGIARSASGEISVTDGSTGAGSLKANYFTATSTTASTTLQNLDATNIKVAGKIYDGTASAGTSGYVLQTTGSGIEWVATSSLNISGGQPLDSTLTALASYNTNGILTQTAADTFVGRTITGASNQITVTNGNGVSGNPTISLPDNIALGAGSISLDGFDQGGSYAYSGLSIYDGTNYSGMSAFGMYLYTGSDYFYATPNYLNFSGTTGASGFGIRNNGGVIEFKNSGGSWSEIASVNDLATTTVAFRVHRNGSAQTVTNAVYTAMNWTHEEFDTNNNFDLSTDRFTPTVAGYYQITAKIYCTSGATSCYSAIYKNGASLAVSGLSAGSSIMPTVTQVVYMNGTTDYLEAYVYAAGTSVFGEPEWTSFSGVLVSPISGSGGGWINDGTQTYLLDSNDRVGIGTSTPSSALSIGQTVNTAAGGLWIAATDGDYRSIYMDTSQVMNFNGGSGNTATLNAAGAWTNASDIAYKENIEQLDYGLEEIMLLNPRRYSWKSNGATDIGFIAQELEQVIPEVVFGENGSKTVSYGQLTSLAISGLQDIGLRIDLFDAPTSTPSLKLDADGKLIVNSGFTVQDEASIGSLTVLEAARFEQGLQVLGTSTSSFGGALLVEGSVTLGSGDIVIASNGIEAANGFAINESQFYVATSGAIGIGTTSPARMLHVVREGEGSPVRFQDANGYCEINPTTASLICTSDESLKENITELTSASVLEQLRALKPVTFEWMTDKTDTERVGFIAQEVEVVIPELVYTDSETGLKSVAYGGFVPYIVSAIKELVTRVDTIATQLEALGARVESLASQSYGATVGAFQNLRVGSPQQPSGITIYDEETGAPYCLTAKNGSLVTRSGACGTPVENVDHVTEQHVFEEGGEGTSAVPDGSSINPSDLLEIAPTSTVPDTPIDDEPVLPELEPESPDAQDQLPALELNLEPEDPPTITEAQDPAPSTPETTPDQEPETPLEN